MMMRMELVSAVVALALAIPAHGTAPRAAATVDRPPATADAADTGPERRIGARVPRPDSLHALYVNGWAAGDRARMRSLVAIADSTEINAFVVDVKESDSYLTYGATSIPLAREIGADRRPASRWLPAVLDTLRAHRIYAIARIVVFKDRMLADKEPALAIRTPSGALWTDDEGKPWVNPYDRRVWDYNVAIAREALALGFDEIQWDYVRFPDVSDAVRATMVFPGSGGRSRWENIRGFIDFSRERLAGFHAPVSADIFGVMTNVPDDMGIGQRWEDVVQAADNVHPMVYPSHYGAGYYGFGLPDAHPYEVVRIALEDGVEREALVRREGKRAARIEPWLQAFTASYLPRYAPSTAATLRDQIQAVYDSGLSGWILWNADSEFEPYLAAFRPKHGGPSPLERSGWRPPRWEVPRERLSPVIRDRERAAGG